MIQKMKKAVVFLDLFKVPITLQLQGQPFGSVHGGLLSFVLLIISFFFFLPTVQQFFSFSQFSYSQEVVYQYPESSLTLNKDRIDFAVSILGYFGKRAYDIYFYTEETLNVNSQTKSQNKTERYQAVDCNITKWQQQYGKIVQKALLNWNNSLHCAPSSLQPTIYGRYSTNSSRLIVSVQRCHRSQCATDDQLKAYDKAIMIAVVFPQIKKFPNNTESVQFILKDDIFYLFSPKDPPYRRGIQINLASVTVDDTNSDIWPQTFSFMHNYSRVKNVFIVDQVNTYSFIKPQSFAMFTFKKSPKVITYTRKILKLDEMFSTFGGFLSIITLIGEYLIQGFNEKKLLFEADKMVNKENIDKEEEEEQRLTEYAYFDYIRSFLPGLEGRINRKVDQFEESIKFESILTRINNSVPQQLPTLNQQQQQAINNQEVNIILHSSLQEFGPNKKKLTMWPDQALDNT